LAARLCQPVRRNGRRTRPLNPYAPVDAELLDAISRGEASEIATCGAGCSPTVLRPTSSAARRPRPQARPPARSPSHPQGPWHAPLPSLSQRPNRHHRVDRRTQCQRQSHNKTRRLAKSSWPAKKQKVSSTEQEGKTKSSSRRK